MASSATSRLLLLLVVVLEPRYLRSGPGIPVSHSIPAADMRAHQQRALPTFIDVIALYSAVCSATEGRFSADPASDESVRSNFSETLLVGPRCSALLSASVRWSWYTSTCGIVRRSRRL